MSQAPKPWAQRRIHFVGVGGAGMSGYARVAHALGAQVSGSDAAPSPYLQLLLDEGIVEAAIGHDARHVPAGEHVEVVFSSAVPPENPERAAARERGMPERQRAELLSELSSLRRTIAVAGTHGKTTTASMLVHALRGAGLDPGWLIGAPVGDGLANSRWSEGEWLVVEADESDRSMLSLNVEIAVLTNVELDHHAAFASLADLREAFRAFLALAVRAIVVWDRPELLALAPGTAGAAAVVPYDVPAPALSRQGSTFGWRGEEVRLSVLGAHNALDAAAALEAARLAGADLALAVGALSDFHGAGRRFEAIGRTARGVRVYDDYAHHPSEVSATLAAARTLQAKRLVAAFQPHLYSRTRMLARELGAALSEADVVIVSDVYGARERAEDHPGVSGLLVAEAAADAACGRPVYWLASLADAERVVPGLLAEGDVCVTMGAGDVDRLARALVADGAATGTDGQRGASAMESSPR